MMGRPDLVKGMENSSSRYLDVKPFDFYKDKVQKESLLGSGPYVEEKSRATETKSFELYQTYGIMRRIDSYFTRRSVIKPQVNLSAFTGHSC